MMCKKVDRCYVAPCQESHNQLLRQVKARMLMQSVEIPAGACAFIRERAPDWRGRVWEECAVSHASCDNRLRLGDDGSGSGNYGYVASTNRSGSSDYGYATSADGKCIARHVRNF